MTLFHLDLALDEQLDALDPLRHLTQQPDDTEIDSPSSDQAVLSVLPNQQRSIHNETLHLSFSNPQATSEPVEIALSVDAGPGCGGIAWPAGEVLSSYLTKRGPEFLNGRTILELGSGTGLVGLVAAKLQTTPASSPPSPVWITDQAPLLDIMRRNITANSLHGRAAATELNWGEPLPSNLPPIDLILAADCVYFEPAFPLLVQTLCDLADTAKSHDKEPEILFCYKKRRKADKRFFGMLKKHFTWNEVTDDADKDTYNREAITLLRLFRR